MKTTFQHYRFASAAFGIRSIYIAKTLTSHGVGGTPWLRGKATGRVGGHGRSRSPA